MLEYVQSTLEMGEEIMFTLDVPATPAQITPIVLAEAAPAAAGQHQADFLFNVCKETESGGDPHSRTGFNSVDPAGMLRIYLQSSDRKSGRIVDLASIKTSLIEGPKHGSLVTVLGKNGQEGYWYNATPNYEGKDREVFMAEFEGKRYKIIVDMRVFLMVDEYHPTCPKPQLIKVKPSSSSLDINGFSVSFSGTLPGGVLGQSVGSTITLDPTAAGYSWYIDYTPYLNDEYLPTSNPNLWVVKEGTEAAGSHVTVRDTP